MTFEEYEIHPDFLEFTSIANTFISLDQNNHVLTEENKFFFDEKIVLVPDLHDLKIMINVAFEPYTEHFSYTVIEYKVLRMLNKTYYSAVRINIKP